VFNIFDTMMMWVRIMIPIVILSALAGAVWFAITAIMEMINNDD